jgi:hypothetical protein
MSVALFSYGSVVKFLFQFTLNVPTTERSEPTSIAELTPPAIAFHTCLTSAIVTIDSWLQNALRQVCTLNDGKVTTFDEWMFTQLILTGYNRS